MFVLGCIPWHLFQPRTVWMYNHYIMMETVHQSCGNFWWSDECTTKSTWLYMQHSLIILSQFVLNTQRSIVILKWPYSLQKCLDLHLNVQKYCGVLSIGNLYNGCQLIVNHVCYTSNLVSTQWSGISGNEGSSFISTPDDVLSTNYNWTLTL